MTKEDDLIQQYSGITGESVPKSRQYLEAFDWNLENAIEDHFARHQEEANDLDDDDDDMDDDLAQPSPRHHVPGGGFRLGDDNTPSQRVPASAIASSSSSKPKSQQKTTSSNKKFATLGDFGSSAAQDDSDDDDGPQDMFAGGEKSGLAVQNPDDLKKKIIEKAQKTPRPTEETVKKSNFTGSARTLGGDDTPSEEIPADPSAQPVERVRRVLHFWSDGFSVDDGELFRFDDQRNSEMLHLIRSGRAPLHIMNVQPGQEVDVEVRPHEENYVKPKKAYKAFEGSGNRLGSPTPGLGSSAVSSMPGAFSSEPAPAAAANPSQPPTSEIDESKPTVTLRVSLGSGTRLTSRFNTTQTIGDVYDFVRRAETGGRDFVLQTTFPTTDLTDKSKVLGDMAEFKRGGAVVQKYT